MNDRDSENIAAQFLERGWEITEDENECDVAVVNTCSVREQAEQKAIGKLGHLVWLRKPFGKDFPVVGVAGCMAQNKGAELVKLLPDLDFVAGARQTHRVADIAIEICEMLKRGIRHPKLPLGAKRTPKTSAEKKPVIATALAVSFSR